MGGHSDTFDSNFRHKTKMVEKTFSNSPSSVILHLRTCSLQCPVSFCSGSRPVEFNKFLVNAFLTLYDTRGLYTRSSLRRASLSSTDLDCLLTLLILAQSLVPLTSLIAFELQMLFLSLAT